MLERSFLLYALACIPFVIHILVPLITRSPPTLLAEVVRASYLFEIFLLQDRNIMDHYLAEVLSDKRVSSRKLDFSDTHITFHYLAEVVRAATSLPPPGSDTWIILQFIPLWNFHTPMFFLIFSYASSSTLYPRQRVSQWFIVSDCSLLA